MDIWFVQNNPLSAQFLKGYKNTYSHFISFLHVDMTQVAEILPQERQEFADSI